MAVVKNLMIRSGADFSGARKEIQKFGKNLADFKSGISSTMKGIAGALATLGIGLAIKDATKEAMTFEASMQQIDRTMGSSAQTFKMWAKDNASAFGMARAEAAKYGAVYSNLISGFAKDSATTTKYTQDLLKASAIIASSTGRTIEDTMDRIRSGMLGSTEAIEDLGINVNIAMIESTDAFKKFANGKSWAQLSFQTQQQIRLFAILEQSSKKYGTEIAQNTTSNQQKFIAQLKNAQLALGQAFLPIYNTVLPALTKLATSLANVMNLVAQFSQALFGKSKEQTKATVQQASAVGELADAYGDAGKAAKGSVSGFDQVNLIGGAGSGGTGSSPIAAMVDPAAANEMGNETEGVSAKVKKMAEDVKTAFKNMSTFMKEHKDLIVASLAGLGTAFAAFLIGKNWVAIIGGITNAFKALRLAIATTWAAATGPFVLLAAAIALLVGAFVYFYRTNEQFKGVVDGILKSIGQVALWLWQEVLVPFGKFIAEVFVAVWKGLSVVVSWLWKNVMLPFGNFMLWFWKNVISPISKALGDVLGVAFQAVADIAKSFWKNVLVPLGNFFKDTFGPAVEAMSAVLTFLWEKVLKPLGRYISNDMKPVWKGLAEVIVYLLDKVLKPIVEYVGGSLKTTFNTVFEGIGKVIDGLKTTFIGLMTFITGVFTGDWGKAWEGVKGIFSGVFGSLEAIVKTPLNLIIDAINAVIKGLNKISIDIPDWVSTISGIKGGKFGFNIGQIPKLAQGGLAYGSTLAMVGDNPNASSDPEVIAPLSKLESMLGGNDNREVVSVLKSILQAVKSSGSSEYVSMNKTDIGRAAAQGLNDLTRRTGRNPVAT